MSLRPFALRSTFVWLWTGLWGICTALLGAALFLVFNPWVDPRRTMMERVSRLWAVGVFWTLRHPVRIEGLEHVTSGSGPYVICPNHQSVLDILVMLLAHPHFKFIAKTGVFWLPPMALQVRLSGYIQASRGEEGGSKRVLGKALAWLRRGSHLLNFPEGTRSPAAQMLRFRQAPFVIAQQAGVKVLPVAIFNTGKMLPKRSLIIDPRFELGVRFLAPMEVVGDTKAFGLQLRERLRQTVEEGERALGGPVRGER